MYVCMWCDTREKWADTVVLLVTFLRVKKKKPKEQMRAFKMLLFVKYVQKHTKKEQNEKLKCIYLYNWTILAAWITKEALLFCFFFWHNLRFERPYIYDHSFIGWLHGLKFAKVCCRITSLTPFSQIVSPPPMNSSPTFDTDWRNKNNFNVLIFFPSLFLSLHHVVHLEHC